jgi:Lon protease-like protein
MEQLPLFPLNTVLFPGMPLYLHIFEERYKQMINRCLETGSPFGVLLIRRGVEALGPLADPHRVGCTAKIQDVQRLDDGRMNLLAMGQERFRVVSLDSEQLPYLTGEIEPFPLRQADSQRIAAEARRLREGILHYLDILNQSGAAEVDGSLLPEAPVALAYAAASVLQAPPDRKQELLEAREAADLIAQILQMVRRETALLQPLLAKQEGEEGETFSKN